MQITNKEGYTTEEYGMFSGFKLLISEEKRDSKVKLQKYNNVLIQDVTKQKLQASCDIGDLWQINEVLKEIFGLSQLAQVS